MSGVSLEQQYRGGFTIVIELLSPRIPQRIWTSHLREAYNLSYRSNPRQPVEYASGFPVDVVQPYTVSTDSRKIGMSISP